MLWGRHRHNQWKRPCAEAGSAIGTGSRGAGAGPPRRVTSAGRNAPFVQRPPFAGTNRILPPAVAAFVCEIKPEVAPAYNPPIYDNPRWERPGVSPTRLCPQEYAPPSDVPPEYIGPPK